jgi:small multidrug resistance family-3 protein
VIANLIVFVVAATLEIGGCFAFWMWLRRGAAPSIAVLGIGSLVGFAAVLTRADAAFAGRAYAAYGGIYVAASLAWLWLIEGQRPTAGDLIGASIAIAGTIVILLMGAQRSR